jgi:hypothetical protein
MPSLTRPQKLVLLKAAPRLLQSLIPSLLNANVGMDRFLGSSDRIHEEATPRSAAKLR